jgi:endonuclease/exonuclease/phosphatase family metal-dependent hydrolase
MANVVCSPSRTVRFLNPIAIALIAMVGVAASVSAQTTVTLSTPGTHVNADLTIQGGASGMTDFSDSPELASKVSSPSYTRRILLKFNTQDFIPANATIKSARVDLVLKAAESGENRPFTAYYVRQSFHKGETNWYYFSSGQAWATAGADLGTRFGTTYVGNAVGSTYSFDVTQLVQRTVNGEFGSRYTRLALVDTGASTSGNYRAFHSTRSTNTGARPRLVITYTTSGTATTTAAPAAPSGSGTTLKVMQWNIHKTKGSDGVCNADRTVNTILSFHPDVVSMNEVDYYSGACGWNLDQGEQLRALMQQKSGVAWYRQSDRPAVNTGDVLLSRYPLTTSSSTLLSNYRAVAQVGIVVNGRNVNLFSTHIEWDNASWRPAQIAEAVRWMSTFAEPRIMMGDFNTWPNTTDYYIIATPYQDAWVSASSSGTATSYNGTGNTEGQSRLDYVFFSRVSNLALNSVTVPNTVVNGVRPSDHDPVVAVFTVK